ncbi:hypothetical protein CONCODRAFT_10161 [Conidiobolus coronatus NRRL 28638]|uniref:F-box domain-containing protein n=1 Tax=Conidiobolus coronatus (strain ATCC 28846 / CBS 209.66 / NRRL 28638) TaxID=796925 RepID=A0A137NXV3_CONC2|nr:hypothetical protein CONCODRAFT_10161 [Conidiobolus coronatus NRRL 28638]|eukprot:KXN67710.1 hypothetical protein CONCODRAFT_10161 [Conidiobolus coronatus NRRL 28638]
MLNVNRVDSKKDIKYIKWDEIFILYEFKTYLARSEFIELSLLNKLLREKLKHKVFYKLNIDDDFLLQFPNYFYQNEFDIENELNDELETVKKFQSSRIEPFITDLIRVFDTFGLHLKQIEFDRLYRPGYFIIPVVGNFTQLSSLSIYNCELELKIFIKFMTKLCKLEYLSIKNLQFLALYEEWPLDSEALLPQTLQVLELGNMRLRKTDLHKDPYRFLIDNSGFMNDYYYIPPQHLRNLKHLIITEDIAYYSGYIPKFLDLNQHLTRITFPCYYLSSSIVKSLSTINRVNEIQIVFKYDSYQLRNFDIMPLDSVHVLSIESIPSGHYPKVYILINLFPKLTRFHASFDYFEGKFIEILAAKLGHLNSIELEIQYFSSEEFDLSIFSNIETLKLDIYSRKGIGYKLPAHSSKLKLIKIASNNCIESFNIMLESYKNSSIWNIKLLGKFIICIPI